MLKKVKKWFGIEGLKISLDLAESYERERGEIDGVIELMSMNDEEVTQMHIKLIEKYARGRGKSRLIDEYVLGELKINQDIIIRANELKEVPFTLKYNEVLSDMDEMERSNFILSGIAKVAKFAKRASSEFRVEISAKVKGTKFSPYTKETIVFS